MQFRGKRSESRKGREREKDRQRRERKDALVTSAYKIFSGSPQFYSVPVLACPKQHLCLA